MEPSWERISNIRNEQEQVARATELGLPEGVSWGPLQPVATWLGLRSVSQALLEPSKVSSCSVFGSGEGSMASSCLTSAALLSPMAA